MEKKLTAARQAMIEALRQVVAGKTGQAKKSLRKAKVELNKQYS